MRPVLAMALALGFSVATATGGEARKWTARTGDFSTEAELVDVSGGNVVLKKKDGANITVPLDRLSLADVRYVEQYLRDATAAVGKPVGGSPADGKTDRPEKEKASSRPAKSSDDRGPPLARPNASEWQVRPDPGDDTAIRDVSISLPNGGGNDLLFPSTLSRFVGLVASGPKPAIQAWDLRSGDRVGPITMEGFLHPPPALSPDGDLVAIPQSGKPKLQVWSLKRKSLTKEIDLGERGSLVQYLAFAGPRRLLIGSGFNQGLRVLDPRSGAEIAKVDVQSLHNPQQAAISPGGSYIALSESSNKAVQIFDLRNGERAGELEATHEGRGYRSLSSLRFSADGQELAALYDSPKAALFCWSMKNGKPTAQHEFERPLHEYVSGGSQGTAFDFIPGGKGWLLGGKAVVDREKGGPIWVAKSTSGRDSTFLRMLDGERFLVAAGSFDNRKLTTDKLPWSEITKSAAIVEKGGTAADAGLPPITKANASAARQLTLTGQRQEWKAPIDAPALEKGLTDEPILLSPLPQVSERLLIAPAGPRVIVSFRSTEKTGETQSRHRFRRFNLKTGKEEGSLEPTFAAKVTDVNLEGTRLAMVASAGGDRVDIYEFAGGKHIVGFRPYQGEDSYKGKVIWTAFAGDDRLLTLNNEGKLLQWSLPDCQAVYSETFQGLRIVPLSLSRKIMVLPVDGSYQVVDVATTDQLGTLEPPDVEAGRYLSAYEFSPDGKMLAAILRGLSLTSLVCWDMTTGKLMHKYELEAGEDVTWANDKQVLIQRPLLSDRNVASQTFPPKRCDLLDLASGRTLWRYQLPIGQFGSQPVGGRVWYLSTKDFGQPARLVGATLPGKDTAATIAGAPKPQDLLPSGTAVTLDVSVAISGDAIADKVLADDVRNKLTEFLSKRGLKVQDRSALALRVDLRETLTGRFVSLRPVLGGITGRYEVRGTVLTSKLQLIDVTRQPLWSRQQVINAREEIPRTGIPKGIAPSDFVRQQQWSDAVAWLTGGGLPAEIYEGWAYSGMGESVLSPTGETLLSLDLPGKK
jgi:WD40 repeat protein